MLKKMNNDIMPSKAQKRRNIAMDDNLWDKLIQKSKEEKKSISWLIRESVKRKILY